MAFTIILGSYACQSLCVNSPVDHTEQNKLVGQSLARGFNAGSNKTSIKASTLQETPILTLVPPFTKDYFTRFMKVFIETTRA